MPPTETKFRLSRIVVSAVVFISLCAPTEAEGRRCYWCGPLAEQVHRSHRAPPCSTPQLPVTDCDPGFPYCAVVASAPPYIESRYCVKLYQDECYSLYCNSTRTWRMTCPCRGDICNGLKTERELDAFAGLAKLVTRTQQTRNKRALTNSAGFISMNRKNRIDNTTVDENKNTLNNTDDNKDDVKANEIQSNDIDTAVDANTKDINSPSDTTAASVPQDVMSDETQMIETTTQAIVGIQNREGTTNSPSAITDEVIKTMDGQMNETSIQIDIPSANVESSDLKTEIIVMSSETTKLLNDTLQPDILSTNVNIPDIQTTPEAKLQTVTEPKAMAETTTEATKSSPAEVKISEKKEKPMEQLPTIGTIHHDTTAIAKTTPVMKATTTSKPQNNTAEPIDARILTIAIGVVLNYV